MIEGDNVGWRKKLVILVFTGNTIGSIGVLDGWEEGRLLRCLLRMTRGCLEGRKDGVRDG